MADTLSQWIAMANDQSMSFSLGGKINERHCECKRSNLFYRDYFVVPPRNDEKIVN